VTRPARFTPDVMMSSAGDTFGTRIKTPVRTRGVEGRAGRPSSSATAAATAAAAFAWSAASGAEDEGGALPDAAEHHARRARGPARARRANGAPATGQAAAVAP
jgi:hypothetical protein